MKTKTTTTMTTMSEIIKKNQYRREKLATSMLKWENLKSVKVRVEFDTDMMIDNMVSNIVKTQKASYSLISLGYLVNRLHNLAKGVEYLYCLSIVKFFREEKPKIMNSPNYHIEKQQLVENFVKKPVSELGFYASDINGGGVKIDIYDDYIKFKLHDYELDIPYQVYFKVD